MTKKRGVAENPRRGPAFGPSAAEVFRASPLRRRLPPCEEKQNFQIRRKRRSFEKRKDLLRRATPGRPDHSGNFPDSGKIRKSESEFSPAAKAASPAAGNTSAKPRYRLVSPRHVKNPSFTISAVTFPSPRANGKTRADNGGGRSSQALPQPLPYRTNIHQDATRRSRERRRRGMTTLYIERHDAMLGKDVRGRSWSATGPSRGGRASRGWKPGIRATWPARRCAIPGAWTS